MISVSQEAEGGGDATATGAAGEGGGGALGDTSVCAGHSPPCCAPGKPPGMCHVIPANTCSCEVLTGETARDASSVAYSGQRPSMQVAVTGLGGGNGSGDGGGALGGLSGGNGGGESSNGAEAKPTNNGSHHGRQATPSSSTRSARSVAAESSDDALYTKPLAASAGQVVSKASSCTAVNSL